jgi:hypothetical protein
MAALALGLLAIIMITGRPTPTARSAPVTAAQPTTPNPDRLRDYQDRLRVLDERIEKGVVKRLEDFVEQSFERMEYGDAIAALEKSGQKFEFPVKWGMDLQSEHERFLTEKHAKKPVIVMNYPKAIKAFYMRLNDDGRTVAAMDVLAPGIGEIVGGSQREERLDFLDARMAEVGIEKDSLNWYRDLRRYDNAIYENIEGTRLPVYAMKDGSSIHVGQTSLSFYGDIWLFHDRNKLKISSRYRR